MIMIKILFVIPTLGHGGAEKVLVNLVNNINKEKFDITVLTLFDEGVNKQFLKEHIHYKSYMKHQFKGNTYYLKLFSSKTLYKTIIKDNYDIIVSYLEGPTARIVSGCTNLETKLVSWIHVEQHNKKIASHAFRSYNEALECYRKFDKTICVSEYVKNDFSNIYDLENPIEVLYNTNETNQILELSKKTLYNIFNRETINIIGVGKVIPNKGFDRLARIHKKLVDEGLPIHTYILGEGNQQKEIENYLIKNNIQNTFTFLGYQTNPYKYVANADVFVCSSHAEGFSTAATEALIVGTPVVTTRVSGMEEMLGKNNEYGLICDDDDGKLYECIKKMIVDRKLREYYKVKSKERGSFFSKEKTVRAVEDMFIRLIREE